MPRRISTAGGDGSFSPVMEIDGRVKESSTPSPAWRAVRSLIATGTRAEGGTGSPGAPQPAVKRRIEKRNWTSGKNFLGRWVSWSRFPFLFSIFQFQELQDVAAQILVLDDVRELLGDVSGVHLH